VKDKYTNRLFYTLTALYRVASVFKVNGVDEIVCIRVIPDDTCEFNDGMGMLIYKSNIGFGKRSWR
jgi:peroxiredoxin